MAIPYRTTKFKSANIFAMAIWAQPPNLIPANISGYAIPPNLYLLEELLLHIQSLLA